MIFPKRSTVPPSDLQGQQNGNLDLALLTRIGSPTSLARLHHTVARGCFALVAAAKEAGGWTLTWTSIADTYRTFEVQKSTFVIRYVPVSVGVYNSTPTARRKRWMEAGQYGYSSTYWVKKNFGTEAKPVYAATAATPGTSPHGMGCAIDGCFPGPVSWAPALPWLINNVHRFGFAWSLDDEPWHIQWIMGDVIPQAVLDYENPSQPEPDPEEDMLNKILIPAYEGVPDHYPHLGAFDSGVVRPLVSGDIAPQHSSELVEDEGQYRRLCAWANIPLS